MEAQEKVAQIIAKAIDLGGYDSLNCIIFEFDHVICTENGDEITSKRALKIQDQMLKLGFEGAVLGHPLDEGDNATFYFKTSYLDHLYED